MRDRRIVRPVAEDSPFTAVEGWRDAVIDDHADLAARLLWKGRCGCSCIPPMSKVSQG